MRTSDMAKGRRGRPRMSALRSDTSANTLAMMAIALIPLSALVGSGVDTARTYVVKTRLQQACDAGVLAGRKFMEIGAGALDTKATTQAQSFFRNNFTTGWLGTSNVAFTPTKTADQQVNGTASAVVPMTIMKMFDANDLTVSVTCEARYDVADSDIMFVLDVTGSMACKPEVATCTTVNTSYVHNSVTRYSVTEHSGSRMQALREAVVDFDTTVRSNADPSTRIRYGFVPYASNANVGAAIPSQHMVRDNWIYQSRRVNNDEAQSSVEENATGYNQSNCSSANRRVPASGYNTDGTATVYANAYWDASNKRCRITKYSMRANWYFEPVSHSIAAYYATLGSGNQISDPTRLNGRQTSWNGCIEERTTTTATSFNVNNLPADLDPDLIPNSRETRWVPAWPDVTWGRNSKTRHISDDTDAELEKNDTYSSYIIARTTSGQLGGRAPLGFSACPPAARRLSVMTNAEVSAYVNANDFRPHGGTYHDIGMIWGVRMLSPNGIFSGDTQAGPGRTPPRRHIVFMTDGQILPNTDLYGIYGIQRYDNRVGGGTDVAAMTARHTARFLAVCQYARDRLNMTVWVVALSTGLNDDLRACATPGDHAFTASSKTELQTAFKRIAQQVAMLRVSK